MFKRHRAPVHLAKELRRLRLGAVAIAMSLAAPFMAYASDYPSRPITLVVPFAPGGFNDTSARIIAQKLGQNLGQSVVVENRSGASGMTGASSVARAPADGYTLGFLSSGPMASNMSLFKSVPYDPVKDFAPVTRITTTPNVLVVTPSLPAKDLRELVDYLKKNPGKVNYGTTGNGSTPHLSAAVFDAMAGTTMVAVPYRGGSAINAALLSGDIQVAFSPIVEMMGMIEQGKVRAIAVTSPEASPILPNLPPVGSLLPGYNVAIWNGVVAPAKTPKEIVTKLNAELRKVLEAPDVKAQLQKLALTPAWLSPEDFAAYIPQQIEAFAKLARAAGVQAE